MLIDMVVKNYRCFADSDPLRFQIRKGFTGLLGTNNSGKSTILKFFYEFRNLFAILANAEHQFVNIFNGGVTNFAIPSDVFDLQALFWNGNLRDIEIQFRFLPEPIDDDQQITRSRSWLSGPRTLFSSSFFNRTIRSNIYRTT